MRYRNRCQIAGCGHPAVIQLPTAPDGLPTLTEVATAPLRGCCEQHRELVSDRYGAAVDWALLRHHVGDRAPSRQMTQTVCAQLERMSTPWTRSLHRLLQCLPGLT